MNYSYDRTRTAAALPSLRELKLRWIVELAEAMATRFKTVGGWRDFGMMTEIKSRQGSVELQVRSDDYGWTGYATITLDSHGTVSVEVMISTDADAVKDWGSVDLIKLLEEADRDSTRIKVHEEEPPQKAVEDVSLFFSKSLNKLRAAE